MSSSTLREAKDALGHISKKKENRYVAEALSLEVKAVEDILQQEPPST